MTLGLSIIDNLLPEEKALKLREDLLKSGFTDTFFMKAKYQGTNMEVPMDDIFIALSDVFSRPVKPEMGAFRLGHKDTELHTNIHADNPVAPWACVYYLNLPEQCKGGTAFYKHKETGMVLHAIEGALRREGRIA